MKLSVVSQAKVNLSLHVLGQYPDTGYHDLESVVIFPVWGDVITITPCDAHSDTHSITALGAFADIPLDESNLMHKARLQLEQATGCIIPPHHIEIQKNIPYGAGLGGGSANAATMLRLWRELFIPDLSDDELHIIAGRVGADVPVCLHKTPCLMQGFGDIVTPLQESGKKYYLLLHKPLESLETKRIFQGLSCKNNPPLVQDNQSLVQQALLSGRNDLTRSACEILPILSDIIDDLQPDSIRADMTGSGSCCFAVYESYERAIFHKKRMKQLYPFHFNQLTCFYA